MNNYRILDIVECLSWFESVWRCLKRMNSFSSKRILGTEYMFERLDGRCRLWVIVLQSTIYIVHWMLKSFELVWIGLTMFETNEFFFVKKDFRDGIYDWEIGWTISIVSNCFAIDNLLVDGDEVWIGLTKMLEGAINNWIMIGLKIIDCIGGIGGVDDE